ncbi:hypothetical protein F5051DRAFT_444689 [Lentinula edodes]|nr:hypothetical protein F5051DRAFT_444689 [Lentinula edodes]
MLSSRATAAYTLGQRLLKYHTGRPQVFAGPIGTTPPTIKPFLAISSVPVQVTAFADDSGDKNGSNADVEDRPLCREDFVHPDHVKIALDKGTMFVFAEASDLKEESNFAGTTAIDFEMPYQSVEFFNFSSRGQAFCFEFHIWRESHLLGSWGYWRVCLHGIARLCAERREWAWKLKET